MADDFAQQMRRIAKKFDRAVEEVAAETLIDTFTAIIERTPVLEGRLQGEWQTTIRNPAGDQVGLRPKGAAILEVVTTIDEPELYWFVNNMAYAERIEYDRWSHTKAPEGMVRVSLTETEATLRRLCKEAR